MTQHTNLIVSLAVVHGYMAGRIYNGMINYNADMYINNRDAVRLQQNVY